MALRDQGMTSSPHRQCWRGKGESFHIPMAARLAINTPTTWQSSLSAVHAHANQGRRGLPVRGSVAKMSEIVVAIEAAEPNAKGKVTFDEKQLPSPVRMTANCNGRAYPLYAAGKGVADAITRFKWALAHGRM